MPTIPAALRRLRTLRPRRPALDGPPPSLPPVLDRLLERWWTLPPRVRAAAVLAAAVLVAGGAVGRVARSPYGPPVAVAVVVRDLPVGAPLAGSVATERRPAGHVPVDAVASVPDDATVAMGVVAGTVLTARHLRPGGPLADLPADTAAVAVGADASVAHARVDRVADGDAGFLANDAHDLRQRPASGGDYLFIAIGYGQVAFVNDDQIRPRQPWPPHCCCNTNHLHRP